jgi:predicted ATPase/DNA-binding SARP family transcriptional activator
MENLQYQILGRLEVSRADTPVEIKGPKQRALLIFLLLHANKIVSTDKIIDALWDGEVNGREGATLRVHIANLRKVLEPGRRKGDEPEILLSQPPGYLLRVHEGVLDSQRLEELVSEGRRAIPDDPQRASEVLTGALSLCRGPALEDVAYETFAQLDIQRLDELRLVAVEALNDARLALDEHTELISELEAQVAAHPLRERVWGQLMIALYRSGRQAEALAAHRRLSDILGEHGLVPGSPLRLLEDRILINDPTLMTPTLQIRPHRGPPGERTRLIGRSKEVAELQTRFGLTRLLTVTGSGGVGKTRLAQRLAWTLVDSNAEVWWVELSGLTDPARISEQIAAAGGLSPGPNIETVDLLLRMVSARELVIVLDSCEHLIDASARIVDRLLAEAPGVRFIATSREPLQVDGESVWRVSSLAVPEATSQPTEIERCSSVELFLEHSRARGGVISQSELHDVAVICRRLDGIPLALELAAARTTTLSPAEVSNRLADRFSLLERSARTAIPRHRTLEAAIDWSFQLLDEDDRRLLSRLAVFVAGFDQEASQEVCAFPPLAVDGVQAGIGRLVEKSLIEPATNTPDRRFRLTESIQAFAWDRAVDDRNELLSRHRNWALGLAVTGGREILRDEGTWFPRLEAAHEDLRTAFDESLRRGEPDAALRLVGSLGGYLLWRRTNEALKWLEQAMAAADETPEGVRPSTRALCLLAIGPFLCYHNRPDEGHRQLAEAAELYTTLNHPAGLMWTRYQQSHFPATGEREEALRHAQAAVDLAQRMEDSTALPYVLSRLADIRLSPLTQGESITSGEVETVISLCEEALRYSEKLPDQYAATMTKIVLGHALSLQGDADRGMALVEEGAQERNRFALGIPCAYELISAGHLALRLGYEDRSSALIRRGLESLKELGLMETTRPALVAAGDALQRSAPEVAARILNAADHVEPMGYQVSVRFNEEQVAERVRRELESKIISPEQPADARIGPQDAIDLALAHM